MSVTDEQTHKPAASLIEALQSNEIEKGRISFNWPRVKEGCKRLAHITLGAATEDNYALLVYQVPLPQGFPQEFIDKFKTYTDVKGNVFKYTQQGRAPEDTFIESACDYLTTIEDYPPKHKALSPISDSQEKEVLPPQISEEQLLEEINGKVCLIYTGAGISIDGGLPDSAKLKQQLGVNMYKNIDDFVLSMCDPEKIQGVISTLNSLQKTFYGKPTQAHYLLGKIQLLTKGNIAIATENLDKLHEGTGIPVVPFSRIEDIPQEYLEKAAFIITIGLGQNCTGLIPRYKTENPRGKVVAVNLSKPPYSYPVDAFVVCGAKEFCTKLKDYIENNGQSPD
jgi:NAD-dependent SIR2 family protein deacetylase